MSYYWVKTPSFLKTIYPEAIWNISSNEKVIYLTFDDGPQKGITEHVLDILRVHDAKATFFMVGANIEKNQHLYKRVKHEGHHIGNHGYIHENGWKTKSTEYILAAEKCFGLTGSPLMRPPYGKIKKSQLREISAFQIPIFWDVLPGDFDEKTSAEALVQRCLKYADSGSIITLHDNLKFKDKVLAALPKILTSLSNRGYIFKPIPYELRNRKF